MLDQLNQSVEISQKINQIQLYFSMLNLQALNKICDRLYDKINIFHYLNYNLFNYFQILINQDLQNILMKKIKVLFLHQTLIIFHMHSMLNLSMFIQANFFFNQHNNLSKVCPKMHQFSLYQVLHLKLNFKMAKEKMGHLYHLGI